MANSNHSDKEIRRYFKNIFGFRPRHIDPYKIALIHRSVSDKNVVCGKLNNERLEYLGDAILGSIMADFLYHKYPLEAEGVLTRMRSKLVNRARLNNLAKKLGLNDMVRIDGHIAAGSANGNAFEAVVGAIYLDQGYEKTYKIIINNIFLTHLDMDIVYDEENCEAKEIKERHEKIHSGQIRPRKKNGAPIFLIVIIIMAAKSFISAIKQVDFTTLE